jgi:hypothetical protein
MKCLSLWQPWASLLVAGLKQVETRGWPIRHRGPLLIHAAKKWDETLAEMCLQAPFREAIAAFGVPPAPHSWTTADMLDKKRGWALPFGAIVGRVNVVECYPTEQVDVSPMAMPTPNRGVNRILINSTEAAFGDYSPGRFAFLCENAVRFDEPIPFRGLQGLFDVPDDVLDKVSTMPSPANARPSLFDEVA